MTHTPEPIFLFDAPPGRRTRRPTFSGALALVCKPQIGRLGAAVLAGG